MFNPRDQWKAFLARPNDDTVKTIGVAGLVALAAAVTVSSTTMVLRPYQEANIAAARAEKLSAMLERLPGLKGILDETGVTDLSIGVVDLESGELLEGFAEGDLGDPVELSTERDIAGLGTRAPRGQVFFLEDAGSLELLVLPVSGVGYQSKIEALLALESDLNTVAALNVLSHAESPGLGAKITEQSWQELWAGKRLVGEDGAIRIAVSQGPSRNIHEVDGITGATRTGNGITNMLRFWLGPDGYGPFLERLRAEQPT